MNKLSGGKIEFREGNNSGNFIYNTQRDVEGMGEEIYKARIDANLSGRQLIIIGNSYVNRTAPLACEWAQDKYLDSTIKADLYIGTGDPGWIIGATTNHLRKASIAEPIIIGSMTDPVFIIPFVPGRDLGAHYEIFPKVNHAGKMGYFDHPDSVTTIINDLGFTAPPVSRIDHYTQQINDLYVNTLFNGIRAEEYKPISNANPITSKSYQPKLITPRDYSRSNMFSPKPVINSYNNYSWSRGYNFNGTNYSNSWKHQFQSPGIDWSKYRSTYQFQRHDFDISKYRSPQFQQPNFNGYNYQLPPEKLLNLQSPLDNYQWSHQYQQPMSSPGGSLYQPAPTYNFPSQSNFDK